MTQEIIKTSNEHAKRLALVEQERDFLRRDMLSLRENMTKRDGDVGDSLKILRDRDEKINQQRSKKRELKRQIEDLKAQVASANTQRDNRQDTLQQTNQLLTKEVENLKMDKGVIQT